MSGQPAIFLDRDGVVVANVDDKAARTVEQLVLLDNISSVLRDLKNAGYLLIVVSNQPDYALGNISLETRQQIETTFERLLAEQAVSLDAIYYCYHHEGSTMIDFGKVCACRKPRPGMILQAIKQLKIDPRRSWMIGDRASDIKAGASAGLRTILFDPKHGQGPFLLEHAVTPDFNATRLSQIVSIVCGGLR